jgi:hypothetical protein
MIQTLKKNAAFLVSLYSKFLHSTMAAANNQRSITLPPFWADNTARWFAHVVSRFKVKGVLETTQSQQGGHPALLQSRRPSRRRQALLRTEGRPPPTAHLREVLAD